MTQEFKQPITDKRPIVFDWTSWLLNQNNDTIAASSMSYQAYNSTDTSLVITSPAASFSATTTRVWVSAGINGQIYYIYNTITTVGGIIRTKVIKVTIMTETP